MRSGRKKLKNYSFVLPAVILLIVITIFPLVYSLTLSFFHWDLRRPLGWRFAGFSNYARALFSDHRFHRSLITTGIIGVSAVLLEFVLGLGLALLLSRKLVGKRILTTLLVMPVMISPVVAALMWRMLYHEKYGAINAIVRLLGFGNGPSWLGSPSLAPFSVVLVDAWQWTPLFMMILLAGLQSIPIEPHESALVDGASRPQVFWYITLPMLKLSIIAALLIRLVDVIKLFDTVFILTSGGPGSSTETVSYYVYLVGFRFFRVGYAASLSYLLLAIVVVIALGFLRILRERKVG